MQGHFVVGMCGFMGEQEWTCAGLWESGGEYMRVYGNARMEMCGFNACGCEDVRV